MSFEFPVHMDERAVFQGIIDRDKAEKEKYARLDDYTELAKVFGLATGPHHPGIPWFDFENEKWPYRKMVEHLDVDNGKDKCLFAIRGIGKSVLALMLQGKYILKDHLHTLRIGSEAKVEVTKRSIWMRDQLTRLEPTYGPFRGSGEWGKERFTIIREAGGVLDETVTLTSPDSPGTGAHPRSFLIDDGVGDIAEQSIAKMEAGVDWFKRLGSQELAGTRTWVVGTFRMGWNIYRYILENIEKGLRLKTVGRGVQLHEGKQFDIMVVRDRDANGELVFPGMSDKYLTNKRIRVGEAQYKTQFQMILPGDEDGTFSSDSFAWEEPPDGVPLRTYVFTDTATSTGKTKHTSMSAIAAISKTPNGRAYIREMHMGKMSPDKVPDVILDLFIRWRAEKVVYENTGPAAAYMSAVRKLCDAKGISKNTQHQMFKAVGRPADKHYRIQSYLAPHCEQRELCVCGTVSRNVISVGEDNRLEGELGSSAEDYRYGGGGSWDGLDLLADVWGEDGAGTQIFKAPPERGNAPKPKNWIEQKLEMQKRFRGRQGIV
jgi:hypothetical protein